MKRTISLFAFAILLSMQVSFAQKTIANYSISQLAGSEYHENLELAIQYDVESDKVYLDVDARVVSKFIIMKKSDRDKLIALLRKVLEWNEKAINMKAIFEKEVGKINVSGGFKYGDKYRFDNYNSIALNFEGYEGENGYATRIYFVVPKMVAHDNEFMDADAHIIYLTKGGVDELIAGLTTSIDEYIQEKAKNDNIGSQFN